MSSFSSTYPAIRPTYQIDFSNGKRIPPNATFSRSDSPIDATKAAASAVHYWSNEKHLSSENLIAYSNPVTSQWTETNTAITVNALAAPDGTTTASNVLETAATGYHETRETFACTNAVSHTATFYAKANGRTVLRFLPRTSSGVIANVEFTLSGAGSESLISGTATRSIAAVGSGGWYKLTVTFIGNATATGEFQVNICESAGTDSYAGDATKGVYLWGAQVSSTGETVLNETSGQIARSYASTLKSISTAGDARFEYDPTDGQSMGCLIESQATNLNPYSDALASWGSNANLTLTSNAAIGPDGTLGADLMVGNTANDSHYVRSTATTVSSGATYTLSGYFKSVNGEKVRLVVFKASSPYTGEADAKFTLSGNGSASVTTGSATITSVGNGYYRCTVTGTTLSTSSFFQVATVSTGDAQDYVANDYNGVLCAGIQLESGSFASSLIATSGASATRAADSLSVPIADTGYTGGPVSMQADFKVNGVLGDAKRIAAIQNTGGLFTVYVSTGGDLKTFGDTDGATTIPFTSVKNDITANTDYSVCVRWATDDYRGAVDGTLGDADTNCPLPDFDGASFYVGGQSSSGAELDGHIKRVAIFNEALSDQNLQSLTAS